MEANNKDIYETQIRGKNFYGKMQIKGEVLNLNMTEFKKRNFYVSEITNVNLEKDYRRFLIFRKVEDLFDEIACQQNLEISDENTLILPVGITYKGKIFELKIQIPLLPRNFNNQSQKWQHMFEQFQKMNQFSAELQQQSRLITFKGDTTNLRYKDFQLIDNTKIKMIGNNQHTTYNHCQPLKPKGISQFKAKIFKSPTKYIFVGICGNEAKSLIGGQGHNSPFFMGLYLHTGQLYANNKHFIAASGYTIVEGQSIIKVKVDMSKNQISWFHNDSKMFATDISEKLRYTSIYFMVNLHQNGDILEFIDQ